MRTIVQAEKTASDRAHCINRQQPAKGHRPAAVFGRAHPLNENVVE